MQTARINCGQSVLLLSVVLILFLSTSALAQTPIRPYTAALFAGDGAFEFYGPSVMVGADLIVHQKYDISVCAQFFFDRQPPRGSFSTESLSVLYQRYFFGNRRLYLGVGASIQHARKEYAFDQFEFDRVIITGAYRIGYAFYTKNMAICPEIDATGPYAYNLPGGGSLHELLTLPSIGIRFYRRDRDASGRRVKGI